MRFTTSSSKWALVRSDLRRFWPLLFGYAVLWLCAMPVALWSHRDYARTLDHVRVLCDIVNSYFSNGGIVAAAIVPACFTVLLAMALFSYLMNSRSVGLMHALPITRGAQFGVHFAVGVGMFTAVISGFGTSLHFTMTAPSFSQYCLTVYPFIGPSSFPRMVVSSGFTTIFNPHDWFSMSMSPRLFPPTISGRALINVGITFALPSSCGIGIIISSVNLPLATTDLTPRICVSGNPNSSARNF